MPTAAKPIYCPACDRFVNPGEMTGRLSSLSGSPLGHYTCDTSSLSAAFHARYRELHDLPPKTARTVVMSLGQTVCRDKKYVDHVEVCGRAARRDVPDAKWQGAVALATGRAVATHEQGGRAISVQVDDDGALALVVTEAVAAAAKELEPAVVEIARAAALAAVADVRRVEHVVVAATGERREIGPTVHRQFDWLLKMVSAGVNVWLAGPAGSGKTTAAEQAARALGLRFHFNGAIDTEYKLSGFVDAQGRIVSTAFREAYTRGGVYLFDEVDASMPSAVLAFNAALANGACDFPGSTEPTPKHPDFHCVAAGNTWGFGATSEYVGRCKLDAAFLDRFVQLTWDYDETLEGVLASAHGPTGEKWCKRVQRLRAAAKSRGLKVVVSPRATIHGCKLLAVGMSEEEVLDATVFAKLSQQDRDNLRSAT